jgi:hypothetical protein
VRAGETFAHHGPGRLAASIGDDDLVIDVSFLTQQRRQAIRDMG